MPGRAEETAQEESGQQESLQVWREGDAGKILDTYLFTESLVLHLQPGNKQKSKLSP